MPALRWIIAATLVLHRDRAAIGWDRLIDLTGRLRIGLFVAEALTWLDQEFAADLPAEVPARLRAAGGGVTAA